MLSIAPLEVPVAAGDELLVNVEGNGQSAVVEDGAATLLAVVGQAVASVSEFNVRLPPSSMSKMRKAGMPVAVDRRWCPPSSGS